MKTAAKTRACLLGVTLLSAAALGAYLVYDHYVQAQKRQKEAVNEEPVRLLNPRRSAADECIATLTSAASTGRPSEQSWRDARSYVECRCDGGGSICGCRIDEELSDKVSCQTAELEDAADVRPPLIASLADRLGPLVAADEDHTYIVPEEISVFVRTFGCSHNISDSEFMAGLLREAGFRLVDSVDECQVAVLNSCTVKNPSQDGAVNLAVKCRQLGKRVVVGGCVVQADGTIPQLQDVSTLGVKNIDKVVEAVCETLKGNVYRAMSTQRALPELDLPKVRKNALIEIIPLSTGCLGACTYCKTKFARGVLGSYTQSAILARAEQAVRDGVQQIWLTSEDTGAYGIDLKSNIAELLDALLQLLRRLKAEVGRHVMVRLGMTNPPYMLAHLERLGQILRSEHFFEFLHIPVQSGSDAVLKGMNREYTLADFEQCVDGLRASVPEIFLATDFICGFPDETDEDHQESMALLRKCRFPAVNISQFYPRPGTAAGKMKRVPTQIVKGRSQEMTRAFHEYECFDSYVGRDMTVWVSGVSDRNATQLVAHNKQYVKVLLPRDDNLIGHSVCVSVTAASKWHLLATVKN